MSVEGKAKLTADRIAGLVHTQRATAKILRESRAGYDPSWSDHMEAVADELERVTIELAKAKKSLASCDWYWPEDDTSSEASCASASEVLDNVGPGHVVAVARGGVVEVTYCGFLPAADDSDSDDDFWVEEPTEAEASLKISQEKVRRAALTQESPK